MPFTMEEILQLNILKNCKVLASREHLAKRSVTGIVVIEIPGEDFIQENELVLTTGIGYKQSPNDLLYVVEEVKNAHAAALMIATGKYIPNIPQSVIRFSERHQFPIIELPWKIRFAEIIQTVLQKLHGWNQSANTFSQVSAQGITSVSDFVVYQLADHQEIKNIALQTLQPLIHYKQIDLLKTLNAFIKHRGNVSLTARKMNLHRHSLLYRLQKIEQLIERSLDNPNDLFLLDLSLRLYTLSFSEKKANVPT